MNWWSRLLRRDRVEAHLDAELRDHVERQVADYIRDGLSETEARRRARLQFGGLDQVKELCRDARGTRMIEEIAQDIRYAARVFRQSPGFSVAAVVTLALGIGANMAVFGLIEALLLRPLPVHHPEELVVIRRLQGAQLGGSLSYPQVRRLAEQTQIFSGLCGFGNETFTVGPPEALEPTGGGWVTGGCFQMFGLAPIAGRLLSPEDDKPAAAPVAVITDRYWARKFGRDRGAIGQSMLVDGSPVTIVGVSPPGFIGPIVGEPADITIAINTRPQVQPDRAGSLGQGWRWLGILARPRDGLTREQAQAQVVVVWAQWLNETVSPNLPPDARARAARSAASFGNRCWRRWSWSGWCSSSRASTSPTCCWRGRRSASARSRFDWRSARAGPASSVNC
jgi:putative ABC transport system permease protein